MSGEKSGISTAGDEIDPAWHGSRTILDSSSIAVGWLVVICCVNAVYVAFIVYGSKQRSATVLATLTQYGSLNYMPERELPIYLAGCAVTAVLSIAIAYKWKKTAVRRLAEGPSYATNGGIVSLLLVTLACVSNLLWLLGANSVGVSLRLSSRVLTAVLLLPPALELALFYVSQTPQATGHTRRFVSTSAAELLALVQRYQTARAKMEAPNSRGCEETNMSWRWVDIAVIVLICCILYIPRTDLLAGQDFQLESFHHWDHFAMAPAIGLITGKHLATQVYSQYGIGWPLLLAKLDPWIRLSYGHALRITVVYGCAYYCGLYWLLRKLLSIPAWAMAGVLLALRLQMFAGSGTEIALWAVPSASIMRNPCDIWVLLLLLGHWRSQKPALLLFAGCLVGLSVLFVIDTGIYLALTFFAYNVLWLIDARSTDARYSQLPRLFVSSAAFLLATLVLIYGLVAACGLSVFSFDFLHDWLEVLSIYPEGISMLPIAMFPAGVMLSYWFVIVYLGSVVAGIQRFRAGHRRADEVIIACIALLGLFYLVYYIGRSHPYNLFHLSIPFCILLVSEVRRLAVLLPTLSSKSTRVATLNASVVVAVAGAVVLLLSPQFENYPNVFWEIRNPTPIQIGCYLADQQDICVTPAQHPNFGPFRQAVAEIKKLTIEGKTVAVIANDDTSLYVAARATLWCRYSPLLPPLMMKSMLDDVDRQLATRPVNYVFVLKNDPATYSAHPVQTRPATTDAWAQLFATTRRFYHFDHICGAYEVWRR